MRRRWIISAALLAVLGLAAGAFAERPPEQRSQATHVVVGTVAGVYTRDEGATRDVLVEIAVEKVEKGEGFKPGETFYVGVNVWVPGYFQRKDLTERERKELALRADAYDGVPKEGERVRVYAKHEAVYPTGRRGKSHGIYPDWYDVVKGK